MPPKTTSKGFSGGTLRKSKPLGNKKTAVSGKKRVAAQARPEPRFRSKPTKDNRVMLQEDEEEEDEIENLASNLTPKQRRALLEQLAEEVAEAEDEEEEDEEEEAEPAPRRGGGTTGKGLGRGRGRLPKEYDFETLINDMGELLPDEYGGRNKYATVPPSFREGMARLAAAIQEVDEDAQEAIIDAWNNIEFEPAE